MVKRQCLTNQILAKIADVFKHTAVVSTVIKYGNIKYIFHMFKRLDFQ